MNQEFQQFISQIILFSNLQCPQNYNMIEYVIGEQQKQYNQGQIDNYASKSSNINSYQITKDEQHYSQLDSNQLQSNQKICDLEYIDYKMEEQLNEYQDQSEFLVGNLQSKNFVESKKVDENYQFNTFTETNFLTNFKCMLSHSQDFKNYNLRTSILPY